VRNAIDDSGFLDQVIGIESSSLGHFFRLRDPPHGGGQTQGTPPMWGPKEEKRQRKRKRDRERGKETEKEKKRQKKRKSKR